MKFALIASIALFDTATAMWTPDHGEKLDFGDKKQPCSQAVVALATGIHLNIQGQFAEYNGTEKVEQVEQAQKGGPGPAFYNAKGMLQTDIQVGMNLRQFNQQIAPPGNPAIPGLAQYEAAQQTEKNQVNGLTGNYAVDKPTFDMLKMEIMKGIQLNEKNLKAAVSECDFTLVFPPADEMAVS